MSNTAEVKLSIIIPCYNGWEYMDKCLRSLELQTRTPYEVIIIDDCSTDNTYANLQEYVKNTKLNIILMQNSVNSGPGKTRQYGIEAASGNYLAFCDCDDWYELDFVESLSNAIQEQKADVLLFDNYISFEDGKRYRANRTTNTQDATKETFLIESNLSLCRFVALASLFQSITHVDLHHEEDSVVVIQVLKNATHIGVLDKALYNYFFRDGSLSKKDSPQIYKDEIAAFNYIEGALRKEYPVETEYIGARYVCYSAALYAFRAGIATKTITSFLDEFEARYPNWYENKYISNIPITKRYFVKTIKKRRLFFARILASCHHILAKLKRFINK